MVDGYTIMNGINGQFVQMLVLLVFLFLCAVIDIRKRIVPNLLIIIMAVVGFGLLVLSFDALYILAGVLTFFFTGAVLFTVSWLTKEGFGMGDAKLIMCAGLYLGVPGIFGFLFLSFFFASVFGVVLILIKKGDRKTTMPLAPFLLAGLLVQIFI